jgi:hypothetical protein
VPFDLLTFIAERGDWPWLGRARTCTGPWKTKMVYQAFTPQVRALRKETDGPLMFANVLGTRAEESTERRNREMWPPYDRQLGPGRRQVATRPSGHHRGGLGAHDQCRAALPLVLRLVPRRQGPPWFQSLFVLGLHPGQPPRSAADRRAPSAARRAVRAGRTRPPGAVQPEHHHGRAHRAVPSARRPGPWRRG